VTHPLNAAERHPVLTWDDNCQSYHGSTEGTEE
jgi:hypothetical protein